MDLNSPQKVQNPSVTRGRCDIQGFNDAFQELDLRFDNKLPLEAKFGFATCSRCKSVSHQAAVATANVNISRLAASNHCGLIAASKIVDEDLWC